MLVFAKCFATLLVLLRTVFKLSLNVKLESRMTLRWFWDVVWVTVLLFKNEGNVILYLSFCYKLLGAQLWRPVDKLFMQIKKHWTKDWTEGISVITLAHEKTWYTITQGYNFWQRFGYNDEKCHFYIIEWCWFQK